MGFKPLTINTVADEAAHIYAQDDAAIFQSIFGIDGVFSIGNMFQSTVLSNNKVRLSNGVVNVGGHIGRIEYGDYEDIAIENGTAGYYRNDIIYAKFLTSGDIDTFSLAVKKGIAVSSSPTDPGVIQGDVYQGAVERDYPLYRVRLEGLSIVAVEQLFEVVPTIPELVRKNNEINNAKLDKTATAASANKLATARTIRTNLASISAASFDGSKNIEVGIIGTLPVIYGGTGVTTLEQLKARLDLYYVDNTADSEKSVRYAASAGNADTVDSVHVHNMWSNIAIDRTVSFSGSIGANNNVTVQATAPAVSGYEPYAIIRLYGGSALAIPFYWDVNTSTRAITIGLANHTEWATDFSGWAVVLYRRVS